MTVIWCFTGIPQYSRCILMDIWTGKVLDKSGKDCSCEAMQGYWMRFCGFELLIMNATLHSCLVCNYKDYASVPMPVQRCWGFYNRNYAKDNWEPMEDFPFKIVTLKIWAFPVNSIYLAGHTQRFAPNEKHFFLPKSSSVKAFWCFIPSIPPTLYMTPVAFFLRFLQVNILLFPTLAHDKVSQKWLAWFLLNLLWILTFLRRWSPISLMTLWSFLQELSKSIW